MHRYTVFFSGQKKNQNNSLMYKEEFETTKNYTNDFLSSISGPELRELFCQEINRLYDKYINVNMPRIKRISK